MLAYSNLTEIFQFNLCSLQYITTWYGRGGGGVSVIPITFDSDKIEYANLLFVKTLYAAVFYSTFCDLLISFYLGS